jgi:preprotein translocase subunit SecE
MSGNNEKQKKSYLSFISDFFREIKKVVWPTPKETFRNTWITLIMIFIVGVFVFILDLGLINLLSLVMMTSK